MPTIPLFTIPNDPDASHRVTSPGGYECWHFDAEDVSGRLRLVANFHDGYTFHPGYLRRYAKFLANPTRVKPPLPANYPCVSFAFYEDGKIAARFLSQYPASAFWASVDQPEVAIGPNHFRRDADGQYRLTLSGTPWRPTWRGPKLITEQKLSAKLTFRPLSSASAIEQAWLSRQFSGAEHYRVIANPFCEVTGTIRVDGLVGGGAGRAVSFSGRGYHDHTYGTAPIGNGMRRLIQGRAIADDRIYTFQFAEARDRGSPSEVDLVRIDRNGQSEMSTAKPTVDWSHTAKFLLAYPNQIEFSSKLILSSPKIVDSSSNIVRLVFNATLDGSVKSTALCEVVDPQRFCWPILGGRFERSIHQATLTHSPIDSPSTCASVSATSPDAV